MNFSTIPSDCILLIFNRIPLQDLLFTTNLVCRQWNALQPTACLRRRFLKLLIGSRAQSLTESSSFNNQLVGYISRDLRVLRFRELSTKVAFNILTKLPNIQRFQISRNGLISSELFLLNRVLLHWSSSLVSLKLYLKLDYKVDSESLKILIHILNRMPKLNILTIDLGDRRIELDQIESFPVIHQLDQFQFNSADRPDKLLGWLKSNENKVPIRIGFGDQMKFSADIYRQFLSLSTEISTRITHLPLRSYYLDETENQLENWCSKFPALESIKIQEKQIEFSKVATQMKPLTKLIHLHMIGNGFSDVQSQSLGQQFPSVKVIQFDLSPVDVHLHLDTAQLEHYFPSVEVVKLRLYTKVKDIRSCLQPLKMCPQLKHIYLSDFPRGTHPHWSIDEL